MSSSIRTLIMIPMIAVPTIILLAMVWNIVKTRGGMKQRKKITEDGFVFTAKELPGLPLDVTVEITGTITGNAIEPTTSAPCAWWHLTERRGSGDDAHTIRDETSSDAIQIADSSGSITFYPEGVESPDADFKGQTVAQWVPNPENHSRLYSVVIPNNTEVTIVAQVGQDENGRRYLHQAEGQRSSIVISRRAAKWLSRGQITIAAFMITFVLIFVGVFLAVWSSSEDLPIPSPEPQINWPAGP